MFDKKISYWLGAITFAIALAAAPGARAEEEDKPAPSAQAAAEEHQEAAPAPAPEEHKEAAAAPAPPTAAPAPEDDGTLSPEEEKAGDEAAASHDPAKYAEYVRMILPKVKAKALAKIEEKLEKSQAEKMERLSMVLGWLSLSGLLLLLAPLFLAKKYPGKTGVLVKSSALAAFTTVLVMNLFAGVILLLKNVQGALAHHTNPQIKVVEAAIDGLDDGAEHLIEVGPSLIQPTLDQMATSDTILPVALLENVQRIGKDAAPFISIAKWFKGLMWIFEYVPVVMTIVAVFLFVVGVKPIIVELIKLPARTAAGEDTQGVVKEAFKRVGRELLATLCLIVMLTVVTLFSGELLALAVRPAVNAFLDTFLADLVYVQTPNASSGLIFTSLLGVVLFLALNVMVILISTGFFLGKAHKVFQQKFHDKVPLAAHRRFFGWGLAALVWAQLFPVLFALAAEPALEKLEDGAFAKGEPSWPLVLLGSPVVLVVGFLAVFWAARALKGLVFVKKYDVPAVKVAYERASSPAPAAPLAA